VKDMKIRKFLNSEQKNVARQEGRREGGKLELVNPEDHTRGGTARRDKQES